MTAPRADRTGAASTRSRRSTAKTAQNARGAEPTRTGPTQLRQLDVPEIIGAARSLVASQGLEVLSMRALARELGVSPMAAYHHVGNKNDLLALLIDDVLAQVDVPPPDWGSWEDRLRELNRRSTAAMAAVPGIDQVMFNMRPTPEGWRLIDAYVGILLDAGFSERQAALAFSVIHSYGVGRSGMEQELRHSAKDGFTAPNDTAALRRLDGIWSELHRSDYREFALEVIIAGLRTFLAQGTGKQATPGPAATSSRASAKRATTPPRSTKRAASSQ